MGLFEALVVFWVILIVFLHIKNSMYLNDLRDDNEELYKKIMDVERQIYRKVNWDE